MVESVIFRITNEFPTFNAKPEALLSVFHIGGQDYLRGPQIMRYYTILKNQQKALFIPTILTSITSFVLSCIMTFTQVLQTVYSHPCGWLKCVYFQRYRPRVLARWWAHPLWELIICLSLSASLSVWVSSKYYKPPRSPQDPKHRKELHILIHFSFFFWCFTLIHYKCQSICK